MGLKKKTNFDIVWDRLISMYSVLEKFAKEYNYKYVFYDEKLNILTMGNSSEKQERLCHDFSWGKPNYERSLNEYEKT